MSFRKTKLGFLLGISLIMCLGSVKLLAALPDGIAVSVLPTQSSYGRNDSLEVEVRYTNTTDAEIKFLSWGTALEGRITSDLFRVEFNGEESVYEGPILKRLPPPESAYIDLAPNESRVKIVGLGTRYNIHRIGTYQVSYRNSDDETKAIVLTEERPAAKLQPIFRACGGDKQTAANSALSLAEVYINNAKNAMLATPVSARCEAERFEHWFGDYDLVRWNRVQDGFNKIATIASSRTVTFDCACTEGSQDTVAYVYPSRHHEVYLCPGFFTYPTAGGESKAGVVVHELSHFTDAADTDDHVYSTGGSYNLARTDPERASRNAANFEYFSTRAAGKSMPTSGGTCSAGGAGGTGGTGGVVPPEPEPEPEPELPVVMPMIDLILDGD